MGRRRQGREQAGVLGPVWHGACMCAHSCPHFPPYPTLAAMCIPKFSEALWSVTGNGRQAGILAPAAAAGRWGCPDAPGVPGIEHELIQPLQQGLRGVRQAGGQTSARLALLLRCRPLPRPLLRRAPVRVQPRAARCGAAQRILAERGARRAPGGCAGRAEREQGAAGVEARAPESGRPSGWRRGGVASRHAAAGTLLRHQGVPTRSRVGCGAPLAVMRASVEP